jgi:hypothetical protein
MLPESVIGRVETVGHDLAYDFTDDQRWPGDQGRLFMAIN